VDDFKIFSLDVKERCGYEFKISSNNFDGGVIVISKNDFHRYFTIKSFPDAKSAREWIDDLVSSTRNIYKVILSNK